MKVLFVCNNVYHKGNGQSVAVKASMAALREHGVDVRLMSIANPDPNGPQPEYPLEHWKFPIFEPVIYANGLAYAKIDKKKIREAVEWADIVHIQNQWEIIIVFQFLLIIHFVFLQCEFYWDCFAVLPIPFPSCCLAWHT